MKFEQLLENKSYLYEGLDSSALRTAKLWESVGRQIAEAQMTADQIDQLFQQVEKGSTDAGGNRTMIGKGKDVTDAVKKAYDDLVSKVQNSGPIKDIDAKYDQAAAKLKQATGGDQGVMKYIEKYRKFAKEHPVAQGLIYSALIAAAGISGVGIGGAAALGLLKMTDKLLQGEKFSTAVGKGIATGATAFAAGQVGKMMHGGDQVPGTNQAPATPDTRPATGYGSKAWQDASDRLTQDRINSATSNGKLIQDIAGKMGMSGANHTADMMVGGVPVSIDGVPVPTNLFSPEQLANINAVKAANAMMKGASESIQYSKKLSILEVRAVIGSIAIQEAGVWDTIKGAAGQVAGAVADKAKTVGHNLTTKVTADKLQSAWKTAGSPMDSDAVAEVLKQAGVSDDVIKSTFASLQIPVSGAPADVKQLDGETPNVDAGDTATADAPQLSVKEINKIIPTLRMRDLLSLQRNLDSLLNKGTA